MELKNITNKVIGRKQVIKAIDTDVAVEIFVAKDAEARVVSDIILLAKSKGIPLIEISSKKVLGELCEIEVGAAVAAIIKPNSNC